ncbi:MAG: hypothetical protein ABI618_19735 [Nitrospirota bacterium]
MPHWTDPNAKQLACLIHEDAQNALYLMFNASTDEAAAFHLPPMPTGTRWHCAVDTSNEAPQNWGGTGDGLPLDLSQAYHLSARASAILVARPST